MPLLGTLLASLFGSLLGGLGKDAARKAATLALALASFAAATVTLMAAFRALVAPLVQSMFSTSYGQFIGLAFPPVAGNCMAAYIGCWIACAVYRAHLRITQTTASA